MRFATVCVGVVLGLSLSSAVAQVQAPAGTPVSGPGERIRAADYPIARVYGPGDLGCNVESSAVRVVTTTPSLNIDWTGTKPGDSVVFAQPAAWVEMQANVARNSAAQAAMSSADLAEMCKPPDNR
jgi:hypothetical protein